MVLEHLVKERWLERKFFLTFCLSVMFSVIGIILARLLFPKDPAVVSVAFTSLLLLTSLYRLFSIEEKQVKKSKKFRLRILWSDESDFVRTYLCIMAGVFLVYAVASMVLPSLQVSLLFKSQLELKSYGSASSGWSLFSAILSNNLIFLLAVIIVAFLIGDGAVFLLTWNASVWGTLFGVAARNAAIFTHGSVAFYFFLIMLIILPHALLELLSYILGAITGGLFSKDIVLEEGEKRSDMFKPNYYRYLLLLLIVAFALLLLGAFTEAWVLKNVDIYRQITAMSLNA